MAKKTKDTEIDVSKYQAGIKVYVAIPYKFLYPDEVYKSPVTVKEIKNSELQDRTAWTMYILENDHPHLLHHFLPVE